MVHVSAREIDGRVRSCRVLNLVHDFIISKAESFISVSETNSISPGQEIRCLSLHNLHSNLSRRRELCCIRTLVVFGRASSHSQHETVLKTFKFLRVLDLQGVPLENFPNSVVDLTLLRDLSLRKTKVKTVPKTIKKLAFLETLDLKHTR